MGIVDAIREYAASRGYYKHDDEYIEDDYIDEEQDEEPVTHSSSRSKDYGGDETGLPPLSPRSSKYSSSFSEPKIVDISARVKTQLVLSAPKSVDDAGEICDHIISNKVVAVNLESVDHETSQRIIDFLCGVTYALKGDIQPSGRRTFVVVPQTVQITGTLKEELEESGIVFPFRSAYK